MASSAFKSTTRRSCYIGSEGNTPPVSGSRPVAGSRKGIHRRSRSSTDFSQKYLSDTESRGRHRGKSSALYMSSDSESDMEAGNRNRRIQQRGFEFSGARDFCSNAYQPNSSRIMPSDPDFSPANPSKCSISLRNNDCRGDHPDDVEEEKTIKAVCAQLRSMKTDSLSDNLEAVTDAIRAEVRHAVADIRMELEQSMKQSRASTECPEGRSVGDSMGSDVIEAIADIRNKYAIRLQQSEKKVRELWAQLAVEERRCLEFAKIVKELLPAPTTSHKVARRRKSSAEKQLVSKWLDDEAHKYLEECVSISSLESDDLNACYRDEHCQRHATQEVGSEKRSGVMHWNELGDKKKNHQRGNSKHAKCGLLGKDGVVLPWLEWDADSAVYEKKSIQGGKGIRNCGSSNNSDTVVSGSGGIAYARSCADSGGGLLAKNGGPAGCCDRKPTAATKVDLNVKRASIHSAGMASKGGILEPRDDAAAHLLSAESMHISSRKMAMNPFMVCADDRMLERIKYRNRIQHGELILCMGFPF